MRSRLTPRDWWPWMILNWLWHCFRVPTSESESDSDRACLRVFGGLLLPRGTALGYADSRSQHSWILMSPRLMCRKKFRDRPPILHIYACACAPPFPSGRKCKQKLNKTNLISLLVLTAYSNLLVFTSVKLHAYLIFDIRYLIFV